MNRSLKVSADMLAAEAAWMAKLPSGYDPLGKVVQVSAVLGALQLRRTDFDQYRESVIPAEGAGQFDVAVDATKLAEVLKGMRGMAVVDVEDKKLTVSVGGTTAALRAEDDVEFPAWPMFTPTDAPAVLRPAQVARVLVSVGTDDTLPALTSVAFDYGAMVTTDRFRLTRIVYADSGFSTLVPGATLRAFARGKDMLTVEPGDTLVRLCSGGRSVIVTKPDTEFPKWRQLIPTDAPVSVLLRRDDLLAAVGGEQVTLTVYEDGTILVTSADDDGDLEVTREISGQLIRGDGLPFTVRLRSKYLTECLRNVGCGAVRMEASSPTKPLLFQDVGKSDLHLIMPIRMPT
jgi:DNA polymerase-3 subunit beta